MIEATPLLVGLALVALIVGSDWWEARGSVPRRPPRVIEAVDLARFERAPCYLCGYSGEGYFQPASHPCAALYHAGRQL